jgi:hypothetical protein
MISLRNVVSTEETETASLHGLANPARRILVVEDDSDIRRFNAEALRRSGYQGGHC